MKKEIDQWRAELFATGNFDREQLEELEGHLWDEIDHMDSSALSPEEKLIIAQKLIGTASDLTSAYKKNNGLSLTHLSWGIQVLMAYFAFRDLTISLNWIGGDLSRSLGIEESISIYALSVGLQALGILAFFFFVRYVIKLNQRSENAIRLALVMTAACLILMVGKVAFFNVIDGPQLVVESLMVTQVISFLPFLATLLVILWISLKSFVKNRKSFIAK